ncbi:VCBS repeat-containing protein, partial [Candidatus Bipolaricaulota bacterium]|nr:VCBS repeat-containing protein [Candidatus Bipolaricaulota bacterium]
MKRTLHPRRRMIFLLLISLALCSVAFGEGDDVAISPRYGVIRETGGVATTSPFIPHEYSGSVGTSLAVASEPCVGDFDGDGYADYCLPQFLEGYGDGDHTIEARFLAIVGFGDGQGGIDDGKGESGYREIDGVFPEVLDCGDLDEDGCDDIITVTYSDSNDEAYASTSRHYSVWFGNEDSTFSRVNMLGNDASHYALKLVDSNADDHLDVLSVVLTEDGEVQIWLLLGRGDGQFSEPTISVLADAAFVQKQTIRVGDVNGDTIPDVILATINPADHGLYRLAIGYGNRSGVYVFQIDETLQCIPRLLAVGDINGDGVDDVCVVHWLDLVGNPESSTPQFDSTISSRVSVYVGVPREGVRFLQSQDLGVPAIFSFLEDLNEDGYADAEFITDQGIGLVLPGSQDGLRGSPMTYSAANGSHSQCILGGLEDVNADGKLDLYVQLYEQELVVRFGNEEGGFGTGWMAPPMTTDLPIYATALAGPADFDKDGRLDLVFLKGAGAGIAYGNNLGGFDEVQVLVDEFGWSSSAIGDFNGDGLSDILLGQEFATWDNKLCLFLNEGDRRLSRSSKSIPSLVSSPSATTYGEDVIRLL